MYQKIALAIAFSPRMEALIAETKKLVDIFQSELILIHVGEKSAELEEKLSNILNERGLNLNRTKVLWKEGKPAKSILKTCEEENVDLLVMGALKKEGFLTYYIGSVARKVIRKANCSVLTLIDPKLATTNFSKIVINGTQLDETSFVIQKGLEFGHAQGANVVHILNEIKLYGLQMATAGEGSEEDISLTRRKLVQDEIQYVQDILNKLDQKGLKINIKVTAGKWAVELSKFAQSIDADVLIMGDRRVHTFLDRLFPHDLEEILMELPCNLLIVK
jgi:nucleotide-binding universal stress UspA family protein